jgi:cobalt-precorrin 5A hydrolase
MELGEAVIIAGIGCRKGAGEHDIGAAIAQALARAGLSSRAPDLIAVPVNKSEEHGIVATAARLKTPLAIVADSDLRAAGRRAQSYSLRVMALFGVPSVAEAAALAAGGPQSRLIAPKLAVGSATCALATCDDNP